MKCNLQRVNRSWDVILVLLHCIIAMAESKLLLTATAPVNPVRENGMLSFMCKISDLDADNHGVRISRRTSDRQEWISYKNLILADDERIFLAIRHIGDGSVIYFLTITNVARDDEGEYTCKVLQDLNPIATDSSHVQVDYYPTDIYPACHPNKQLTAMEGVPLSFNCTSEEASPSVSLTWAKTGSKKVLSASESRHNGLVTSTLTITPTRKDHNAMYLCKIVYSGYYPNPKFCHVGPLHVVHNPNIITPERVTIENNGVIQTTDHSKPDHVFLPDETTTTICRNTCPYFSGSLLRWIISTAVAAFLAVLFFIIGVTILYKWNKTVEDDLNNRHHDNLQHHMRSMVKDDIYMELEKQRENDRVYMALDKFNKQYNTYNQAVILQHRCEFDTNGNPK